MQIGPRIRIGGTVGKIGQSLKKPVGSLLKVAAPILAATGVGAPLAAGLGALGGAMSGGGVKGTIMGGLSGGGGALLGNAIKATSLGKGAANALGSVKGMIPDRVQQIVGALGGGLLKGPGGDGVGDNGYLGDLGGLVTGQGGKGSLLNKVLGAGAIAATAADRAEAKAMRDKAAGYATGSYDSRAPLRAAGLAKALDESPIQLPQFGVGNVYGAATKKLNLASKVPAPSPTRPPADAPSAPAAPLAPASPAGPTSPAAGGIPPLLAKKIAAVQAASIGGLA